MTDYSRITEYEYMIRDLENTKLWLSRLNENNNRLPDIETRLEHKESNINDEMMI